jgi:hypothetical protein
VVTARPSALPAEPVRLLDDLAAERAPTLQLQPLSSDDVAVIARQVLGASPGPQRAARDAPARTPKYRFAPSSRRSGTSYLPPPLTEGSARDNSKAGLLI